MSGSADIRASDCPTRNPSVDIYSVGDDAVLHDPVHDQVFAINPLAREMWNRCNGTSTLEAISREISSLYDVPLPVAAESLKRIAVDLLQQELLYVHDEKQKEPAIGSKICINFDNHQVVVYSNSQRVTQAVRHLFFELIGSNESSEVIDTLSAYSLEGRYRVQGSRFYQVEEGSLQDAIRSLKHEIVLRFIEARPDLLWLHAGAVVRNEAASLFVGAWGSGKSTAVANLYRAGWTYLSDDIVPYDPKSGHIFSFPLTPAYRQSQEDSLSKHEITRLSKKRVDINSERVQKGPVSVRAVFFPSFQPDAQPDIQKCKSVEGAVSLIQNCENANQYRGHAIQELCALASRVPSFRLIHNHQAAIANMLESVV